MSATYAIYTSPTHKPIPDHLPTLIITPHGKPHQILYTYLHTNYNRENYLLTPSDQGDLCVAKLFPPSSKRPNSNESNSQPGSGSSNHHHSSDRNAIRCEASRNLRWTIRNEGIQNPVYKLTLPNPDNQQIEQPLFQVSKPNPNSPWWTLFYFTYAGHLIPPKRIEFGKIMKNQGGSGETRISVTGKSDEEKAVWKTLGDGNEDMVEWILICASLNVLDDEITKAAEAAGLKLSRDTGSMRVPTPQSTPIRQLHPTGNVQNPPGPAPIRPAIYHANSQKVRAPTSNTGPTRSQYPVAPPPGSTGRAPAPPAGGRAYPGPQVHHPQSMTSSQGSSRSSNDSHRPPTTPHRGPNEVSYHNSPSRPDPNRSRPNPNGPSSRVPQAVSYPYDQQILGAPTSSRVSPQPCAAFESRPQVGLRAMAQTQARGPPPPSQQSTYQQQPPQSHHSTPLRSAHSMAQTGRAPIQVPYDHTSPLRVRKVK